MRDVACISLDLSQFTLQTTRSHTHVLLALMATNINRTFSSKKNVTNKP